jgi:hypothetical protein
LQRSSCGTGISIEDFGGKRPEIAKFPVIFPVSREFGPETGSHMTAHTTIQSYETPNPGADSEWAVSVGIFAGIVPLFRSPGTLAVSQADF